MKFSIYSANIKKSLMVTIIIGFIFCLPAFSEELELNNVAENQEKPEQQNLILDKTNNNSENTIIKIQDLKGIVKQEEIKESRLKLWFREDYLTGDLVGLRTKLKDKGINFNVNYYNDDFMKFYGGVNNKNNVRYHGLVEMSATLDTEKAKLWPGGQFHIQAFNKHGLTLTSKDVGDLQYYDNTDLPRHMLLSQYWFEQGLFSNRLKVKVGKQNASYDFDMIPSCFNLLNVSQSLMPTIPLPAFANPALGITTTISPSSWLSVKTGFFDGAANPNIKSFKTAFDGKGGALTIVEPKINHSIKGYPGTYLAGFWHHSGNIDEITSNANPRQFAGSAGYYTSFEQMIFKENKVDNQGITVNSQFGWTQGDRKLVSRYYGVGLQYKGLIPKRNNDNIGIGSSIARLSKRQKAIDGKTGETALEMFYTGQITPWLAIQPDIQFIFNPGGKGKDAMIFGIRTVIKF